MASTNAAADAQLETFIAAYAPDVARTARAALKKLRGQARGATALVYDNYNGLAIAFGPTERTSDAVLSLVLYPRWVTLFFVRGASLPDPERLLRGSGARMRHVKLAAATELDRPAVRALIGAALRGAAEPLPRKAPRRTIVKSISAKRRPRRPGD